MDWLLEDVLAPEPPAPTSPPQIVTEEKPLDPVEEDLFDQTPHITEDHFPPVMSLYDPDPLNLQQRALALLGSTSPMSTTSTSSSTSTCVPPVVVPFRPPPQWHPHQLPHHQQYHQHASFGGIRTPFLTDRELRVQRWRAKRKRQKQLRSSLCDRRRIVARARKREKGRFVREKRMSFHRWSDLPPITQPIAVNSS